MPQMVLWVDWTSTAMILKGPQSCNFKFHFLKFGNFVIIGLKNNIKWDLTCQMFQVPCTFFQVIKSSRYTRGDFMFLYWFVPVLEIPIGPPVRGRQLWRTGYFLLTFLQFHVYDLRFKVWGPTTFFTEFQTLVRTPPAPLSLVHAITSEQLFRFLSFLVGLVDLTYRLPD